MAELIKRPADLPALAAEGPQQYLTFLLGGEMFAVGILNVKEIIEYGAVTEIPMVPRFIRGVINLRGAVVPVIDLPARFGDTATQPGRRTCTVILELPENEGQQVIGVVVDAVSEVLEMPASAIEPPPAFGARIRTDFIRGMGKIRDRLSVDQAERFVIILDVARVLATDEMALLSKIALEGSAHPAAGSRPETV